MIEGFNSNILANIHITSNHTVGWCFTNDRFDSLEYNIKILERNLILFHNNL